jgi:hypothetical protein
LQHYQADWHHAPKHVTSLFVFALFVLVIVLRPLWVGDVVKPLEQQQQQQQQHQQQPKMSASAAVASAYDDTVVELAEIRGLAAQAKLRSIIWQLEAATARLRRYAVEVRVHGGGCCGVFVLCVAFVLRCIVCL